jgi:hypothetical protein
LNASIYTGSNICIFGRRWAMRLQREFVGIIQKAVKTILPTTEVA